MTIGPFPELVPGLQSTYEDVQQAEVINQHSEALVGAGVDIDDLRSIVVMNRGGIDPTAEPYGMSHANSEGQNVAALLNAANDAIAQETFLRPPIGEFPMGPVTLPGNTIMEGMGHDRTVFTRSSGGNSPTLTLSGSAGTAATLQFSVAAGSTVVSITANPDGITTGDLVYITDTRTVGTSSGAIGFEMAWVASVVAAGAYYNVTLRHPILHQFSTALGATMRKITPASPRLIGVGFVVTGGAQANGIRVTYTQDAAMEGIAGTGFYTRLAHISASVDARMSEIRSHTPSAVGSGEGYGVQIDLGSRNIAVNDISGQNNRHLVVVAHAASFVTVRGGHASGGTAGDFDIHGQESRFVTFDDCHGDGTGPTFNIGNDSYGSDSDIRLDGCGANTSGVGYPVIRCFNGSARIDIDGLMVDGGYAALWADACSDITIRGGHTRNNTYGVYGMDTTGVKIDGLMIHDAATNAVKSEGTSDQWSILGVDYVSCAAGESLVGASNTTANIKTR